MNAPPESAHASAGGADLLTERAAVVLTDRPIVAFGPGLVEAQREYGTSGRKLQVVTPSGSRVTAPLCQQVAAGRADWVVRADGGYYAGLTGRPLYWDGQAFTPSPDAQDYAPGFRLPPAETPGILLTLILRARHTADGSAGGPVTDLMRILTAADPAGWGTFEPASRTWAAASLDPAVREDALAGAPVVVVGGGMRTAIAVMEFSRTEDGGFTEQATIDFGYRPGEPLPLEDLPSLVGDLGGRHPITSLLAQVRPGRADLTVEPRWTGTPSPIGLAITGTHPALDGIRSGRVGSPPTPMTWFNLGDGRSPDGWHHYQRLLEHLKSDP
ncbi:DUF6177 family protein [Spirillospora sp. NPDC047279]|uniref:DUF6177 family protein n=1 Tax=Spirillospora sp. NPDC047279 TaxID=3155478 RepID=UPI00341066C5